MEAEKISTEMEESLIKVGERQLQFRALSVFNMQSPDIGGGVRMVTVDLDAGAGDQ